MVAGNAPNPGRPAAGDVTNPFPSFQPVTVANMIKASESPSASSSPVPRRPSVHDIEQRARALWEREGRPEGRSLDHWFAAERELTQALAPQETERDASCAEDAAMVGDPAYAPLNKRGNRPAKPAPPTTRATEVKNRPAHEMQPAAKTPAKSAVKKPAAKPRRSPTRG